ncbi:MAG: hypothetical protein ACLQVJ_03320 [Syntrophobacteraceae bacterium]
MNKKQSASSAIDAIDRMMDRLQSKKTLRHSWNTEYWLECADYLEESATWIRRQLAPPVALVENNSTNTPEAEPLVPVTEPVTPEAVINPQPTTIPDFVRRK